VTYGLEKWSGRLDSNQRPPAPKWQLRDFKAIFVILTALPQISGLFQHHDSLSYIGCPQPRSGAAE